MKLLLLLICSVIIITPGCSWLFWGGDDDSPICDDSDCKYSWGICSRTCGNGTQQPLVTKPSGPCGSCDLPQPNHCFLGCCPINCRWSEWENWMSCSASCGGGVSKRTRLIANDAICGGKNCSGPSEETRSCNEICCPEHCEWSGWGNWGECSATCGGGTASRQRIVVQTPACEGMRCEDRGKYLQTMACNTQCCAVNCSWGEWGNWEACSTSCGVQGVTMRQRSIASNEQCGGATCGGDFEEMKSCNRFCLNGEYVADSACVCIQGWTGECCGEDINECAGSSVCGNGSDCTNEIGGFRCTCREGFVKHSDTTCRVEESTPEPPEQIEENESNTDWMMPVFLSLGVALLAVVTILLTYKLEPGLLRLWRKKTKHEGGRGESTKSTGVGAESAPTNGNK